MMKMKKYIGAFIIALTTIMMVSCDKKADVDAVAATLPGIQLSSVGMFTTGPYALPVPTSTVPNPINTIQVIFGATTTNKTPGVFDVVITDVTTSTVTTTETLHFPSWNSADNANTPSAGSISFATVPNGYPNTTVYQGSIILKYGATTPFVTGHIYTVKCTASASDATTSVFTQAKLFAIQ